MSFKEHNNKKIITIEFLHDVVVVAVADVAIPKLCRFRLNSNRPPPLPKPKRSHSHLKQHQDRLDQVRLD